MTGIVNARVLDRVELSSEVCRLTFERVEGRFSRLEPGAHIDVHLDAETVRQYSLVEWDDLVRYFRTAIKRRRRGRVIRIEFAADTPPDLEELVRTGVGADSALVAESAGFIGIADLG